MPPNPFTAIPLIPPDVEQRLDRHGMLHLRRLPPLRPLQKRLASWLGHDYRRKLELDEHGALFFRLVDGTRSLRTIADAMAAASHRPQHDVDAGIILFTKKLMTLHMLELKISPTQ